MPRQGNLAPHVVSVIEFEKPYRHPDCVRGLEQFSHVWLIWGFDRNGESWSPTVRPPRLGGNERLGVFATRSSFRPNGLGLSVVKLLRVEEGPRLLVSGADLVNGTPIYDIKPYIPYADALPDATAGFTATPWHPLAVRWACVLPDDDNWRAAAEETLAQDPRPAYQDDPQRRYHLVLLPFEITFRVEDGTAVVLAVAPYEKARS